MHDATDIDLLQQYGAGKDDTVFAALVSRHVNLVYSVALRKTCNVHAAEEITQAVFILLAQKAGSISDKTILPAWLYQTARLTAANFLKKEARRVRREQEAYMQTEPIATTPDETWERLAPLLDDAVGGLNAEENAAIVLRFFGGKSFVEVGMAAGISENAAKKRVGRALEKLHRYFTRRGVSSTTAIIALAISAHSVQAAPAALAPTVTAAAVAKGAAAGGSTSTLIKGAWKIMAWTKMKTTVVAGVAVLLVAGMTATLVVQHKHRLKESSAPVDYPRSSWSFAGYATPEDTAQSLFWAMRESSSDSFQIYLNGLVPALRDKMQQEAQKRGSHAFAELSAQEMGGVTRYRILKTVMLSYHQAQLQIQFGGLNGPVQTLAMEKIGDEWKCAGE